MKKRIFLLKMKQKLDYKITIFSGERERMSINFEDFTKNLKKRDKNKYRAEFEEIAETYSDFVQDLKESFDQFYKET